MTTFFLFQSLRTVRTLKTRRCDLFHRYTIYMYSVFRFELCVKNVRQSGERMSKMMKWPIWKTRYLKFRDQRWAHYAIDSAIAMTVRFGVRHAKRKWKVILNVGQIYIDNNRRWLFRLLFSFFIFGTRFAVIRIGCLVGSVNFSLHFMWLLLMRTILKTHTQKTTINFLCGSWLLNGIRAIVYVNHVYNLFRSSSSNYYLNLPT